jgi:pimeloyl-ACP methyl ester carboxylesterase
VLVKAANWLSHLEYDWNSPVWRHWLTGLANNRSLVRYDERGCGLSDWNVADFSLDAWVLDLETVVDALGLERFPLLGISQGASIAITYAVRHPEKVTHLILYGGYLRGRNHRNLTPQQRQELDVMLQLIKIGWGQEHPAFRQVFSMLFLPEGTPEQLRAFNELQRITTSPEIAARIVGGFQVIDVREQAKQVTQPTLVLHAENELRVPFEEGRLMAAMIPNARLVPLESKNHILLENEPAWQRFLDEVNAFLAE